ncbi:hypothetical protein DMB66_58610 [Actinoplanes sp. ATCC 53533]|uniref:hypothetical protein n=1 Tax=Actinoplanes sp. ATCC 53533 TaxID=1288362 RepID=UPI000F7B93BE|nr:hypothetical protein [Actinoplanes sp. ATCC 53533]RSM38968.1 hypothetical protein DMB66_58610 [Actinoplanes sp. ATCC 53533]
MTWHAATESFDGATTSGLYSQLAGVLAGIAFAALLLYVTRASKEVRDAGDQVVIANLTAAVAALILCAASYAVLAGAPNSIGSASLATIIYGLPFGMSVLLLFYALAIIFRQRPALRIISRISMYVVAAGGPVWVFCYVTMAAMTAVSLRCGPGCEDRPPLVTPVVVGLALIAVLVVGSFASIRVRRFGPTILGAEVSPMLPAVIVLLATFAAGASSLAFPLLGVDYQPSDTLLTLLLSVDFIALLIFFPQRIKLATRPSGE